MTIVDLIPPYFHLWHLPVVFLAGLIGEGYGTVIGSGGILIQFILAALGMPLPSVVATDLAGSIGANVGVLSASSPKIWQNRRLILLLSVPLLIGGIVGTAFLVSISAESLKYVVIAGLVALLLRMLVERTQSTQTAERLTIPFGQYPLLFVVMSLIGVYGNVSGVGVGTFQKLAFVSLFRLSFAESLGISNIVVLPAMIFSLVATAVAGLIAWPYVITLWLGTYLGGHNVTKYVRKIPDQYLKIVLVSVTTLYLLYLLFSLA